MRFGILAAALLVSASAASGQEHIHSSHTAHEHAPAASAGTMPLLKGLGRWSTRVTTHSMLAQQYFDQGLNLSYGFNHDEATRSFQAAFDRDSTCGMCAWGIAYALAPNINMPMSPEAEQRGLAAIRAALAVRHTLTAREQDLITAMAERFGEPAGENRAARDSAYAAMMRVVARKYPTDADVQVLFADALMNLSPWNYWTRAREPRSGTLEVIDALESVLARTDEHAGACHFYVHIVEASSQPERALSCAKRLPKLMPGAGHVVHMPAHVYIRVGMYEEAARANIAAMEADRALFEEHEVTQGVYPMFYAKHNIHFLWAAYMMSGQREKALDAARTLAARIPESDARAAEALEGLLVSTYLTHVRFGDWHAMLAEPAPAADLRFTTANWHYARGVAFAGLGDIVAAQAELDSLRAVAAAIPEGMIIILNPARAVLNVAQLVLEGRIAAATGDTEEAIRILRAAAAAEDELTYDEPPAWYEPVRQVLGTVLLDAQRAGEAEAAFRDDLNQVRENGWSLAGLQRALQAQGRTAEAAQVGRRLAKAWEHADAQPVVQIARTRFGTLQLPTGVRMRFAETGARSGETVIMLHGYSDSWYSWSQVLALLPSGIRGIAVDLRGHGLTEYAGSDFSMDAMAADVAALMDRLGISRATIVGHSMGSVVAQAVATRYPDRVEKLVLTASPSRGSYGSVGELGEAVAAFGTEVPPGFIREFQVSTAYKPLAPQFLERVIRESERLSVDAWKGIISGLIAADYRNSLRNLVTPTLLVWGEQDAFFPIETQYELLVAMPHARLVAYEETGHAVHWERTERFVHDLLGFVVSGMALR